MTEKYYISSQELLEDSFRLGLEVHRSGFRPDFIVGVWRGGAPIGIAVQEILHFCGIRTDHIAIRTSSYTGIEVRDRNVRVHGLEYLLGQFRCHHRVLLVDDVFDSGRSVEAVLNVVNQLAGDSAPEQMLIATPWYKPGNNETAIKPDFYLRETDRWLVFPHELEGLSAPEIALHKPYIHSLLDEFGVLRSGE